MMAKTTKVLFFLRLVLFLTMILRDGGSRVSWMATAFVPTTTTRRTPKTTTTKKGCNDRRTKLSAVPPPESDNESDDVDDDDESWRIALRRRQSSLEQKRTETRKRWSTGDFKQSLVPVPDWVRRISVRWPLAVCGTASGDVYAVQCESGKILGRGKSSVNQRVGVPLAEKLAKPLRQLFGNYDGGGTLAIALSWNNVVAHAGRNGGIEFWKIDTTTTSTGKEEDKDNAAAAMKNLIPLGKLLDGVVVTCLDWSEDDDLWIGTSDGRVLVYNIDEYETRQRNKDDDSSSLSSSLSALEPTALWEKLGEKGGRTVLSVKFDETLDVAVAATSSGHVELLSVEEPDQRNSFVPPFDYPPYDDSISGTTRPDIFPLCATIVERDEKPSSSDNSNDEGNNKKKRRYAVACGGNDGSVFLKSLRLREEEEELDLGDAFSDELFRFLLPPHGGPCKCLESPFPGMLLSGGQDGTVRVWDLNELPPFANKYALGGFKVWLGTLCVSDGGTRLVMDGADNAISILNFGSDPGVDETTTK